MKLIRTEIIDDDSILTYQHKEATFLITQEEIMTCHKNGIDVLSFAESAINQMRTAPYNPFITSVRFETNYSWGYASMHVDILRLPPDIHKSKGFVIE